MAAATTPKPIDPYADDRVEHKTAILNGLKYHYLLALPPGGQPWVGTIFLIHGWPDLSFGWRYQIPFLANLGFRVVAPDMCGYGGTDAPAGPEHLARYSIKSAADDLAALAGQLGCEKVVLVGHDWGGMIVYRTAEYHPTLVSHVISICTPYAPPTKQFYPLEKVVERYPQLAYQLQLAGPEVETAVGADEGKIRQFLAGMYGAKTVGDGHGHGRGEPIFDMWKGVRLDLLGQFGKPKLLSERELGYYTEQYARNGMHGPTNWYRTTKINFDNDQSLLQSWSQPQSNSQSQSQSQSQSNSQSQSQSHFRSPLTHIPLLYIQAAQDVVFSAGMVARMKAALPRADHVTVDGAHWVMVQRAGAVNEALGKWISANVLGRTGGGGRERQKL